MSAAETEALAEEFRQRAQWQGHDVALETIVAALCSGDPEELLIAMDCDQE